MGFLTKILLIFFLIFNPVNVFASTEKQVELPSRDSALVINTLNRQLVNNWMDLVIYSSNNPEKEAVLALLRVGAKVNSFNYIINQFPREVLDGISKSALIVSKVYYDPTLSNVMKIGLEEMRINVLNWLLEKEVKVSSGNIDIKSYRAYRGGSASAQLSYTIVYSPQNQEIIIEIFSPNRVATPRASRANPWAGGIDYLEPFSAKISGQMEHDRGSYVWLSDPEVDVSFNSLVPDIQLEAVSPLEAQFVAINNAISAVNDIKGKIQNAVASFLGFIFDVFGRFSEASIFSFINNQDDKTVVELQEEVEGFKKQIEDSELDEKDEEIKRLNAVISQLEKELENSLKEEEVVVAESIVERVNINTASLEDLTKIVHIGPARAEDIISLRPFKSLDDLIRVPGIGVKIIEDIKAEGIAYVDWVEEAVEKVEEEVIEEVVEEYNPCDNGVVDINKASKEDLLFITGIGETKANSIINLRPLSSLDDLLRVSGIGSVTLTKIKEQGCAYVEKVEEEVVEEHNPCDEGGVDINKDPKEDLVFITGVGEVTAERIISGRKFSSLDDLLRVSGIGSVTLTKIKEQGCAYVSSSSSSSSSSSPSSPATVTSPILTVDKDELIFYYDLGSSVLSNQSFEISNTGDAVLDWSVEATDSWLVVNSTSGSVSVGDSFTVSVGVLVDSLSIGSYSSTMTVIGADDSHDVLVTLNVLPEPELADSVVITQIQVNDKEFVELYNPTLEEVSFDGWHLSYFSATKEWNDPYRNWAIPSGFVISPESYFLISVYDTKDADWDLTTATEELYSSGQLGNSAGSVGVFSCNPKESSGCEVDVVGWGEVDYVFEGSPALVPEEGSSLKRRKDNAGDYIDNNDNLTDFVLGESFPIGSQTEFEPPTKIEDLSIESSGDDYVLLSWTESESLFPLTYEVRYLMNESITDNNWDDATPVGVVNDNSFKVELLNFGTTYYFSVRAFDGENSSLVSNSVSYSAPEFPVSLSWSTFQGSSKRNGKIDNSSFVSNNFEVSPFIEKGNMSFYDPILIDQLGNIYLAARSNTGREEGLFSYNSLGELNWYRNFYKGSYIHLLSDGSIIISYHEIAYQKTFLVNINRDGTTKWESAIEESYYINNNPVILANGNIVVPAESKIFVFDGDDGRFLWEMSFASDYYKTNISVSADGNVIYVNYSDKLYRIEDGNVLWERAFTNNNDAGISISGITIGDNGELYLIGFDESIRSGNVTRYSILHSIDPLTGDDLWTSLPTHGLQPMPFVDYNGDVLVVTRNHHNGSVSVYKYSSDGVLYDGFPKDLSSGLVGQFVVDGDNNMYGVIQTDKIMIFDIFGNNVLTESDLGSRAESFSIGSDGAIYSAGSNRVYVIR